MSTIQTGISNPAADQAYARLGRSLIDLTSRTQAAAPDGSAVFDADSSDSPPASDMAQVIARQNQFSALADSGAASSANLSALAMMIAQPATAHSAQANLSPSSVMGVLENDGS